MKIFPYVLLLLLLSACSSNPPEGKTQAEILYKEALQLKDDGRYILALEKLNKIKSQYPYSLYATDAELLQADVLFLQENYVEASAAYLLFRDFHPKSKKIDYVTYRIAESYYQQIPDTYDRDLNPAAETIRYFKELAERFPDSPYVKESHEKLNYAREMLRSKDRYIADFYFRTEVFQASRFWYREILKKSDQKPEVLAEAKRRILVSSWKIKDYRSCVGEGESFIQESSGRLLSSIKLQVEQCRSALGMGRRE